MAEALRAALPDCSADSSSFVCAVVDFLQTLRARVGLGSVVFQFFCLLVSIGFLLNRGRREPDADDEDEEDRNPLVALRKFLADNPNPVLHASREGLTDCLTD